MYFLRSVFFVMYLFCGFIFPLLFGGASCYRLLAIQERTRGSDGKLKACRCIGAGILFLAGVSYFFEHSFLVRCHLAFSSTTVILKYFSNDASAHQWLTTSNQNMPHSSSVLVYSALHRVVSPSQCLQPSTVSIQLNLLHPPEPRNNLEGESCSTHRTLAMQALDTVTHSPEAVLAIECISEGKSFDKTVCIPTAPDVLPLKYSFVCICHGLRLL